MPSFHTVSACRLAQLFAALAMAVVLQGSATAGVYSFINAYAGTGDGGTHTGTFFSNNLPFPVVTVDAVFTGADGTFTWIGLAGDELSGTAHVTGTEAVGASTFYSGTFDILSGAGRYAGSTGAGKFNALVSPTTGSSFGIMAVNDGKITLIPEPATWAFLMAGLGVVALNRRLRGII